jgi:hypothetical protein
VPRTPERTRPPRRTGPPDPAAVAERKIRSVEEPLDVRLRSARPYPLLEVRNPIRETQYLVMLPEFPARESALCTCTDFARRGLGTCKHLEAGFRWLTEHPDAPPLLPDDGRPPRSAAIWKRVDQRLAASAKDPSLPARRWRRAGAVLYEPGIEE